jgi:MoaA/NifB/PqqE/SkfB family radical SAM enzyme
MKRFLRTLQTLATRRLVITFDKVDFTFDRLSRKRLKNWLLTELSFLFKSEKVWAYPTHLQVEPSNKCNLRCPLCHVVTDSKPKGFLNFDDFKKLIDEIGDYLLFLHFWGWGEPFLNENFFSMVKYAKAKGIKIITSTNGHFFENEENVIRLIDSQLDVLIFALDGLNKQTYEKYRKKGSFDRVVKGLRQVLHLKQQRGASLPLVNLRMLVTRDNEDQVESMKAFAQECKVDILTLKTLCSFDNEAEWETILPENLEYRRFKYNEQGEPIRIKNPCKKPWNHPTVYRDGMVVPCDYYTGKGFNLGNAFTNGARGFHRVWFGKEFRAFRARFLSGHHEGLRCEGCSLNYADVDRCVSHAFIV